MMFHHISTCVPAHHLKLPKGVIMIDIDITNFKEPIHYYSLTSTVVAPFLLSKDTKVMNEPQLDSLCEDATQCHGNIRGGCPGNHRPSSWRLHHRAGLNTSTRRDVSARSLSSSSIHAVFILTSNIIHTFIHISYPSSASILDI